MKSSILNRMRRKERGRIINGIRWASVLIPIYKKEREFFIVLTKRAERLKHHSGQISFPGGACQEGDKDVVATALREAFEEVGIRPDDVKVIGMLDDEETRGSGYVITPIVGLIPHPYHFTANRDEVEIIIEIPLVALSKTEGGDGLEYWYKDYRIWGLTARVLKHFQDLIQ